MSSPHSSEGSVSDDSEDDGSDLVMPALRELQASMEQSKVAVQAQLHRFNKHKEGTNRNHSTALAALKKAQAEFDILENKAYAYIAALPEAERQAATATWIDHSDTCEASIAAGFAHHATMADAEVQVAPESPTVLATKAEEKKLAAHKAMVTNQINHCQQKLNEDTLAADGSAIVLSKIQARVYGRKMAEIKTMIWPEYQNILAKLCTLNINGAGNYHEAHAENMKVLTDAYDSLLASFAAKNFADDCDEFNNSNVSNQSAGSVSVIGPPLASSSFNPMWGSRGASSYKYDTEKIPAFKGAFEDYPLWRKEWKNSVIVGKDDAWVLRSLSNYVSSPDHPDLPRRLKHAKTPARAFEILDELFANNTVVTQKINKVFTALRASDLENFTPEAQIVSLGTKWETLTLQLEAVGEQDQLTTSPNLLYHAIDLMPRLYKTDFNKKRQTLEKEARRANLKVSNQQMLELWLEYMEDMAAQFRQYEPETLQRRSGNKPEGGGGRKSERELRLEKEVKEAREKLKQYNSYQQSDSKSGNGNDKGNKAKLSASGGLGDLTDDRAKQIKDIWAKNGPCPVCKQPGHTWKGDKGTFASDQLTDCPKFRRMNIDDRVKAYKAAKACRRCISWTHRVEQCTRDTSRMHCKHKTPSGDLDCKEDHATLLHLPAGSTLTLHVKLGARHSKADTKMKPTEDVMLAIVSFEIAKDINVVILLDNGSNSCLITHSLAKRLGLKGLWVDQLVELAGQKPKLMRVAYYRVPLSVNGESWDVVMVGMDRISRAPGNFDVSAAYPLFPHIEQGALDKPQGDIELLIGADQVRLLPGGGHGENMVGNLRVFDIPFGPRKVLMGYHSDITFQNPVLSELAYNLRLANISTAPRPQPLCVNHVEMPNFFEAEALPYNLPAKCKKCRECMNCAIQEEGITVKEWMEYQMLKEAVTYRPETKTIHVTYPIVGDIEEFVDNENQAKQRTDSLINSLKKKKLLEAYQAQVNDFEQRGVWKRTSRAEIDAYKAGGGKVHFVGHHGVQSPSASTPLRIVVDSSLRNNYTGPRLSSLYAKGPNQVANLFKVLIGWRTKLRGGCFDVSKAYHMMNTGEQEFFMRLVLWRDPVTGEWIYYGHTTVGFGCVPASVLLEITKGIVSDLGMDLDPELALMIIQLSYVDDGFFGGTEEEVRRMRGELISFVDGKPIFDGHITQMLAMVSMKPKFIMISGEDRPELLEKVGPVLGLTWEPQQDLLTYRPSINITKKVGSGRAGPDLTIQDIPALKDLVFTRRLCLGIVAQLWDPLGHISCFSIRYKILMKELVDHEKEWDAPLPPAFQTKWQQAVEELLRCETIEFPRSIMIDNVKGRPEIVAFFDGSDYAFGCVIYVRWKMEMPNTFYTTIITSKARVTPKGGITTPRSELSGLIVCIRLLDKVIRAMRISYVPCRITIAGDSKCTVTCVDTNAAALNPYFANRSLETNLTMATWGKYTKLAVTHETTELELAALEKDEIIVDKVHYIPGEQNPGDAPTRGNIPWERLGQGSEWQEGPAFLRQDRETWPLSNDFVPTLPPEERRKRFTEVSILSNARTAEGLRTYKEDESFPQTILDLISNAYSIMVKQSNLHKAQRLVARVSLAYRGSMDRLAINQDIGPEDLVAARWLMALADTIKNIEILQDKKVVENLAVSFREGLPWTQGRMGRSAMVKMLGHPELIVLARQGRLATLVMTAAHAEDHRLGPGDAVYRTVRMGYWILEAKRLAEGIIKSCGHCKAMKATMQAQRMGDLPDQIFTIPIRPFSHITLDFAGAIPVKGDVNQRAVRKSYPLLLVCMNTGSLHIQLARDMSTDTFLTQLAHFFALRGQSSYIYSDMGSNIVSAGSKLAGSKLPPTKEPELGERPTLDWTEIKRRTSGSGIQWTHAPAQAQWRDGRSEAMVKCLKHTLGHMNVNGDMYFSELACVLARAADTINNRPLGVRHHSKEAPDICVVTPNLLLQGSRTCQAAQHDGDFAKDMANLSLRLGMLEQSFEEWWNRWITAVWPSLVPYRKWKTKYRNVRVDDLVLVQYSKKYGKPEFRRGIVLKVFPDEKEVVRTVVVGCRPRHKADRHKDFVPKILEELTVPIQRISVLLAVEERHNVPPANDDLHVCDEELRVASLRPENVESGAQAEQVSPAPPIKEFAPEEHEIPVAEATALINTFHRVPDYTFTCYSCVCRDTVWRDLQERGSEAQLPPRRRRRVRPRHC